MEIVELTNEQRNGLIVDACLTQADGHAERIAALHMIEPRGDRPMPITLGADKGYDAEDFVNELRSMKSRPMWRRKPKDPRSTDEPHGMLDIGRAKSSANGLRNRSAGRSLPPEPFSQNAKFQAIPQLHAKRPSKIPVARSFLKRAFSGSAIGSRSSKSRHSLI